MYKECRHIKSNGCKCHSPALKGKPYCYYHIRVHRFAHNASNPPAPFEQKDMQIPFLEDRGAVQIALSEVVSALASHHIEFKRAALMIYALQVASSNAKNAADIVAIQQVRDISENEEGDELAPEVTAPDPEDEGYQQADREPSIADLLWPEVLKQRARYEAEQLAANPKSPEEAAADEAKPFVWPTLQATRLE
jgi:hypothetical protein